MRFYIYKKIFQISILNYYIEYMELRKCLIVAEIRALSSMVSFSLLPEFTKVTET